MDKFLPVPTNALPGDPNADLKKTVEQTLARLDEFSDIGDLTELHRQARGLVEYLREHDENGRTMRSAQLRIERRIGEVLAETVRPGNPQLSKTSTIGRLPKGVSRDQSSKWQQLAAMPKDVFQEYLGDARRPSVNGALKHALRTAGSDEVGETALYCGRDDLDLMIQRGVKFRTLYADPPWAYDNQGTRGSTDNHYRTMPTAEIAALPIEKLAAEVSMIHLWTTDAFLEDAFGVMRAWGFERKSTLIWEKPQMGLGNYYRLTHEYLLLGTRGGAQFPDGQHGHRSILRVDREKHSQKPELFRRLVEQVSNGPRLELFGRRQVADWTVWGNEVESDKFHQGVGELLDAEQVEESDEL
jgi:N6-adenosine-specific RNA methylase IME4